MHFKPLIKPGLFLKIPPRSFRKAVIYFIIALIVTGLRVQNSHRIAKDQAFDDFVSDANHTKGKVFDVLRADQQFLQSSADFLQLAESVTSKERDFLQQSMIDRTHHILSIGFALKTSENEIKPGHEKVASVGVRKYVIQPEGEQSSSNSVLWDVTISGQNLAFLGRDNLIDPICRKALYLACDENDISISGKIVLPSDLLNKGQNGLVMFAPFYQKNQEIRTAGQRNVAIKGWIYAVYNIRELISFAFEKWTLIEGGSIRLQVYEETISTQSLIYDSQAGKQTLKPSGGDFRIDISKTINGTQWVFRMMQTQPKNYWTDTFVLINLFGGLFLGLILFLVILSLDAANEKAKKLASDLNEELNQSKERLELILKGSSDVPWDWDLSQPMPIYYPKWWERLGFSSDGFNPQMGDPWPKLIHPSDKIGVDLQFKEVLNGSSDSYEIEYRLRHKNGHYLSILSRGFITRDSRGVAIRISGTDLDLTELRKAEEAVRKSEERMTFALEGARGGVLEWNLITNEVYFTSTGKAMLGYLNDEIEVNISNWMRLLHPDDAPEAQAHFLNFIHGESDFYENEFRLQHKNGEYIVILLRAIKKYEATTGNLESIVGTLVDVSNIRIAESQIHKLSMAIEQSPTSILICDAQGFIEYLNPTYAVVSGYSLEEIQGKNPSVLNSGKTPETVYDDIWSTITAGKQWRGELINRKKSGEEYIEQTLVAPLKDANDKIVNFVAFKEDITQKRLSEIQLAESEEKYRLITENVTDIIWVFNDDQKRFEYISPSVFTLLGYTVEEAMLQDLPFRANFAPDIVSEIDLIPEHVHLTNDATDLDRSFISQLQLPCKNGEMIWVEISTRYRKNKLGELEVVGLTRKIEERKQLELDILEKNQKLNDANDTKDKFFGIIAHDLRNPFNSMIGLSELLLMNAEQISPAKVLKYISTIHSTAKNTHRLLENLLEWSRAQTGEMVFTPENLVIEKMIYDVVNLFESNAQAKDIAIHCEIEELMIVKADHNMIHTVLRNLVSNALKFTNRNGTIVIKAVHNQDKAEITVSDNGIGMSKQVLDKLFKINQKVTIPGTENEHGTGLGLLLCSEFITRHREKIWVESVDGMGSDFKFTLPLS